MREKDWLQQVLSGVKDPVIQRMVKRVYQRLPATDRRVIRERLVWIDDDADDRPPGEPRCYVDGERGMHLAADDLRDIETEPGWLFVIAHEFAHVVLRHNEMIGVVLAHPQEDQGELLRYDEEQADKQAWNWGFREGMYDYYDQYCLTDPPMWAQGWLDSVAAGSPAEAGNG